MTSFTIEPYRNIAGWWAFDDEERELKSELFVRGSSEILDQWADGRMSLTITFSDEHIPKAQHVLRKQEAEHNGNWYQWEGGGMRGWLCPALLKFFEFPPEVIHVYVH